MFEIFFYYFIMERKGEKALKFSSLVSTKSNYTLTVNLSIKMCYLVCSYTVFVCVDTGFLLIVPQTKT